MFNREYIFNDGPFSIAVLVLPEGKFDINFRNISNPKDPKLYVLKNPGFPRSNPMALRHEILRPSNPSRFFPEASEFRDSDPKIQRIRPPHDDDTPR